jgi:hypothetical protein
MLAVSQTVRMVARPSVKALAVVGSRPNQLPNLKGFFARVFDKKDVPEPVWAWRAAPEEAFATLDAAEKNAYIAALVPLVRKGRRINRGNLRRLYQLFTFMEMPATQRLEFLNRLESALPAAPEVVPFFRNPEVRRSLVQEAELFASNMPSRAAYDYAAFLRLRLNVKSGNSRKLARLLEKLTDIENRAATLLDKRGHIVRLDDRRLELFKKGVAAIGVPAAVLFPLGTIGLSAEGITTGLIALGGGFILPAGLAMVTGLGTAVALGITTKKLLDLLMPTADADRASIDIEELRRGVVEVQRLFDEAATDTADSVLRDRARERIAAIMERIAPLSNAQREGIESALNHARILSARYFAFIEHDRTVLERQRHTFARELEPLLAG